MDIILIQSIVQVTYGSSLTTVQVLLDIVCVHNGLFNIIVLKSPFIIKVKYQPGECASRGQLLPAKSPAATYLLLVMGFFVPFNESLLSFQVHKRNDSK